MKFDHVRNLHLSFRAGLSRKILLLLPIWKKRVNVKATLKVLSRESTISTLILTTRTHFSQAPHLEIQALICGQLLLRRSRDVNPKSRITSMIGKFCRQRKLHSMDSLPQHSLVVAAPSCVLQFRKPLSKFHQQLETRLLFLLSDLIRSLQHNESPQSEVNLHKKATSVPSVRMMKFNNCPLSLK